MEVFEKMKSAALVLTILLTNTCGGARPPQAAPPATAPETAVETEGGDKMTLTGTLERTVEAGGWVLQTGKKTYLLMFDRGLEKEDWFHVGAKVEVTGQESPDTVTIFMQGTPFKVEKMRPAP